MKKRITNAAALLALLAGIGIGAVCSGIAAFLGGFLLAYAGALTLITGNTDWLWNCTSSRG